MIGQKLRSRLSVWLLVIGLLTMACATTPKGKLVQTGSVLLAVSEVAREECLRSKQQGWVPLTEQVCRQAAVAYVAAAEAWKLAEEAISRDPDALLAPYLVKVLTYLFATVDQLTKVNVPIPDSVMEYVRAIRGGLQR